MDILVPAGEGAWRIVEVKSTTQVEPIHLHDLAFQAFVASRAGLDVQGCAILHLNSEYVRNGPLDLQQLFVSAEVTAEVLSLFHGVEEELPAMSKTIRQRTRPEIQIGPHCDDPYPCPLHDRCWSFLPEQNVLTLYRGKKKGFKLLGEGIADLKDVPARFPLTANQKIQRRAAMTGEPHDDPAALSVFLGQLEYPLSFLDFETFTTPIPMIDGLRPYQQVPFQFSLHVVRAPDAAPEHFSFLAEGRNDPRPEFMGRLHALLPDTGSVVVDNATFEQGRLDECADLIPHFRPWVRNVERRIVDLLLPFRGFRYYHPEQRGSASLKAVLPAVTGRGYGELEIQEGGQASLEFLRVTFTDAPEAERRKVRQQLERYCALDTQGMVWIVDSLRKLSASDARHLPAGRLRTR